MPRTRTATTQNTAPRRGGRGNAWTDEKANYLASLFSEAWRGLGYDDAEYRNDAFRFREHAVGYQQWGNLRERYLERFPEETNRSVGALHTKVKK